MIEEPSLTPGDVSVENHGTIFTFTLYTDEAREWWSDNVSDFTESGLGGNVKFVEHRYARDIAAGMLDAGLEVQ